MSLPTIVLTGPPEMAEDHQILGTGGPLGQCSKKLISNPVLFVDSRNSNKMAAIYTVHMAIIW